jgi:hypothetical protein
LAHDSDNDSGSEDERVRQAALQLEERVKAFLDELAQLSKRFGLYIEGPGKDTFIVDSFDPVQLHSCEYGIMWETGWGRKVPAEICWCPVSIEGTIDINDVGT